MSKKQLTPTVITQLEQLPAVIKASSKYITFAPAFKEYVVQKYDEGYSGWEIFQEAGFPEELLSSEFIKSTIKRWRKTVREHGIAGMHTPKKGRPKKIVRYEDMTDHEKVIYLEAKNAFLVELRAQQQHSRNMK